MSRKVRADGEIAALVLAVYGSLTRGEVALLFRVYRKTETRYLGGPSRSAEEATCSPCSRRSH